MRNDQIKSHINLDGFSFPQEIVNRKHMFPLHSIDTIVQSANYPKNLSLRHGLIGKILFFYVLAEHTEETHYKEYAESLMEVLFEDISINMPITFFDGLSGIGWCIQYLISNHLEEGNANEILEELDNAIIEHDPMQIRDLSFETGLAGIVAYIRSRSNSQDSLSPFDEAYLQRLQEACVMNHIDFYSDDFEMGVTYKKILDYYISINENERAPWESGLLLIEQAIFETKGDSNLLYSEQMNFEELLNESEKPCAMLFTQNCRANIYGIGTYVKQLIHCLVPAGWDVCVFELDCVSRDTGFTRIDGAGYYKLSNQGVKGRSREYNYAQFIIQHFHKKYGNIVCHFNFAIYPLMVERIRSSLQARSVYTLHFTSWSFEILGDLEYLKRIIDKQRDGREKDIYKTFIAEKDFMMKSCDRVIAIAQHSYDVIRDVYKIPEEKLSLVPNGHIPTKLHQNKERKLDLRLKYGFKTSERIIVFCGRLDSIKGIINLIDAFKVLSNEIDNLRLVVIGEGNFKTCFKFVDGLWNKIVFTGFLEKDKILEFFEMADYGVIPSIHEEFGYVALEMMMSGLPIIANNTTGLKNITENGKYGLLYNHDNALGEDGFLSVMNKVLSNQVKIPSVDTKHLSDKYSIDMFRTNILNVYSSI